MNEVPEWLSKASYEELFVRGGAANVLARPGVESELVAVVTDAQITPSLRVLAHELLLEAGRAADPAVADAYCQTLPEGFAHNWWGMPGQFVERLGRTLLSFGEAALPCLSRLLDDRRRLGYIGSEEPTLSAQNQYRVCDLAAYLVAMIEGIPYKDAPDQHARDKFIDELRKGMS